MCETNPRNKLDASAVVVRPMKLDEVEDTVRLFSAEGLHDSVSVVQSFYECDPAAFVVAVDESSGRVVGGCAAPRTTHHTSFLGCYVVDSKYQGMGIGVKLFQKCLDHVGKRNCGLSAIPAKFGIYKDKAGFQVEEGVSMVILEGTPPNIDRLKTVDQLDARYCLRKLTSVDHDETLIKNVIDFDETVHLDNREKLLRLALAKSDTTTVAVCDKDTGKVVGYGCVRPDVIERAMIGPLYATDQDVAEIILGELVRSDRARALEKGVFAVSTSNSPGGLHLCGDVLGLPEVARCAKLYTKFVPPFAYANLFVCHTPDFSN